MSSEVGRELHGEVPHTPATGVDEDALPFVGMSGLDDQAPGCERCNRNARRLVRSDFWEGLRAGFDADRRARLAGRTVRRSPHAAPRPGR